MAVWIIRAMSLAWKTMCSTRGQEQRRVIVHSLVECTHSAVVVGGVRERENLISKAVPCDNLATVVSGACEIRVACFFDGVIKLETLFRQGCVFFTAEIRDPGLERIFAKHGRRCSCAVPGRRPDCASDFRLMSAYG